MAIDAAARAAYDKKVARLIRLGERVQAKDIGKIRASFRTFSQQALSSVQATQGFALTRAIQQSTLAAIAVDIDRLAVELNSVFTGGASAQALLARQLRQAFGESFLPGQLEQVLGISQTARALQVVTAYSADLIDGISDRMRREVNGIVRRAALGVAGQTAFDSVTEIQRALRGDPLRRWRFHAERIYRTETLRVHSILTDQNIRDFNTRIPTDKRWAWSGISRREHSSINGQIAKGNNGRFIVPIKEGGSVRLRFPRDPGGPPSAVINCGCYLVPVPREGAKPAGTGPGARGRRKPRVRKPRPKKPLTPAQRIRAAKKDLIGELKVANLIIKKGFVGAEGLYADSLERIAREVRRLRAKFPAFKQPAPLDTLYVSRGGGGWFSPGEIQVDAAFRSGARTTLTDAGGNAVKVRFTPVEDIEGVWRHEFGHLIDHRNQLKSLNRIGLDASGEPFLSKTKNVLGEEWQALLEKYPTRALKRKKVDGGFSRIYDRTPGERYPGSAKSFWSQNIESEYASKHYSYDTTTTGGTEAWAELVAWITRSDYVVGSLPADLESFAFKVLGG